MQRCLAEAAPLLEQLAERIAADHLPVAMVSED